MPTIDGRDLAKMMLHLDDIDLSDLGEVEFDDETTEESVRIVSVTRDAIKVQVDGKAPKTLSRAVAAKGSVIDHSGVLSAVVARLASEPFCRRAARLLGDPWLESMLYRCLPRYTRNVADGFAVLPDEIVVILGRFLLKQEVPTEDLKRAYSVAQKFELYAITSLLHETIFGRSEAVQLMFSLDHYLDEEANRFFAYRDPRAPFVWPNTLWFNETNKALAVVAVQFISKHGYTFQLDESSRRERLTYILKQASGDDELEATPVGSCGRLRSIALALAWLWDNAGRNSQSNADVFGADLRWLRETFYTSECHALL